MKNDTSYIVQWTTQMRRGWLEVCLLNLLARTELHGYGMMFRLQEMPGLGITEGSLYPLLSRLRLQGLVKVIRLEESPEGPTRKVYGLTAQGRKVLALMNDHFELMKRQDRLAREGGNV